LGQGAREQGQATKPEPTQTCSQKGQLISSPLKLHTMNSFYQPTQADLDNHANQLNPNNDAYWSSRGEDD